MFIELIIGYSIFAFLLDTYLHLRQRKYYKLTEIPPEVAKYQCVSRFFNKETFLKAQSYNLDKSTFNLIKSTFDFIIEIATIVFGFFPLFWKISSRLVERFGFAPDNEVLKTLLFGFILFVISDIIELPFSIYYNFVLEERHGFNKQTAKTFIKDLIKSFILKIIIGAPLISLVVKLINYFGPSFWIPVWGAVRAAAGVVGVMFPTLLVPIFFTPRPFPEGEMKTKVLKVLQEVKFPVDDVKEIDGSTRSAHENAMFTGLFKKNVFVYDTLIDNTNPDDMAAIIAHEAGHWAHAHTHKHRAVSAAYMLAMLYISKFFIFNKPMYAEFGFVSEQPVYVGLMYFMLVLTPIEMLFDFVCNSISRYFEYQADEFATKRGLSLVIPLLKISKNNLSAVSGDTLYSRFYNSHPTVIERIDAIVASAKKYDITIKTEYTDDDERFDNEFMKKQKEERKKREGVLQEDKIQSETVLEHNDETNNNEMNTQTDSSNLSSEKE